MSNEPTPRAEWEARARNDIKQRWPDKRFICLGLANLIDSHRRDQGPSMPQIDYNHMFVILGQEVATAKNQKQCAAAFGRALSRSELPMNH